MFYVCTTAYSGVQMQDNSAKAFYVAALKLLLTLGNRNDDAELSVILSRLFVYLVLCITVLWWCLTILQSSNSTSPFLPYISTSMSVRHPPFVRLQPFPWSFRRTAWFFFSGAHRLSTVATGSNLPNLYLRTAVPIIPLVAGAFH